MERNVARRLFALGVRLCQSKGGRLLLGVNDKGAVVGLPDAAKLLEDLPNKVRDLLGLVVELNLHEQGGLPYLELVVQAYSNPISYSGH